MAVRGVVVAALSVFVGAPGLVRADPGQTPVQEGAPTPAPCETPEEVNGRVRYERALRAWLEGRFEDARVEGQAGLYASPSGRFSGATRELLARLGNQRPAAPAAALTAAPPSPPVNARGELISFSTFTGGLVGGLFAGAVNADGRGYAGLIMLGTATGLVGSIVATQGGPVRPAYPQMLETGVAYGAFSVLLVDVLANGKVQNPSGAVAAGVLAGGALGLFAAGEAKMTGGDAASTFAGLVYGSSVPLLIELAALSKNNDISGHESLYEWTALLGGTAGMIGGPLLNRELNWTIGRWRLVELGGVVGIIFGAGTAAFIEVKTAGAGFGMTAGGAILGLGIAAVATSGFDADEPREHRQALLDLTPDGKVHLGSITEAVRPAFIAARSGKTEVGAALSVFGGRF